MRLLIVEEQLADFRSHHFQYQMAIAEGARELGVQVNLLCNERAKGDMTGEGSRRMEAGSRRRTGEGNEPSAIRSKAAEGGGGGTKLEMQPVLRTISGLSMGGEEGIANRPKRFLVLAGNLLANVWTLRRILLNSPRYDLVLCPTAWIPQIMMFAFMSFVLGQKFGPLALLFVRYPKLGPQQPRSFRAAKRWIDILFAVHPETRILAETAYARKSWEELLGRPVEYVVHPVEAIADRGFAERLNEPEAAAEDGLLLADGRSPSSLRNSAATSKSTADASLRDIPARPIIFGFYGFARHEQGIDVLMSALEKLQERGELTSEFRIVWPKGFYLPDGTWLEKEAFSHLPENVRIFSKPFDPAGYRQMMFETDWLVLPYRCASYEGRCSRIVIEACSFGIPVIYTKGTDLETVVDEHGAGIGINENNADDLTNAILQAEQNNPDFQSEAKQKCDSARKAYSADRFLNKLMVKDA